MVRRTDRPTMTIAVDLGRKAAKQTKTLFLTIFDLHLSIVLTFSIVAYPV